MADNLDTLYADGLSDSLRRRQAARSGSTEAALALGSGALAQIPAGIAGIADFLLNPDSIRNPTNAYERAADRVRDTADRWTYSPRSEVGQKNLEDIGSDVQSVTEPIARHTVDPIGERWPAAGAAILAGANFLPGPKGLKGLARGARTAEEAVAPALETAAAAAPKKRAGALVNLNLRDMSPQEATAAALRGEHLVEGGAATEGRYVGGPRNITTGQGLAANRRRMDVELGKGVAEQEKYLPPEEVGDWYASQRRGVADMAEPYQQPRAAEAEGLFSSQTDPHGELGFALKAKNRSSFGLPVDLVRTQRQAEAYAKALRESKPIELGEKTDVYAQQSDPTRPLSPFGTNDFRHAQYQGYTEASGKPQTTGMSTTQHAFMDAETLAQVDRANRKALGGRTDWSGSLVQEIPWVAEKADALMEARPNLTRAEAIQLASKTIEDYLPEHTASATYEAVPGKATGHVPRMIGESPTAQREYESFGSWRDPKSQRDKLYGALDMYQRPGAEGVGVYGDERNVVNIARPMVDFVSPPQAPSRPFFSPEDIAATAAKGRTLASATGDTMSALERFRGAMDAQEAAAYHVPFAQATRKAGTKTHGFLPMGRQATPEEMQSIIGALPPGFSPSASSEGVMLVGPEGAKSQAVADALRRTTPALEHASGVAPERVGMEGDYMNLFRRGSGEPTPASQGVVTSEVLQGLAKAPPEVARRLSESEGVRGAVAGKHERDVFEEMAGQPVRQDIQKMREFFSRANWEPVVADVRAGTPPEQAVAKAGYNLKEMGYTKLEIAGIIALLSGGGAVISKLLGAGKNLSDQAKALREKAGG